MLIASEAFTTTREAMLASIEGALACESKWHKRFFNASTAAATVTNPSSSSSTYAALFKEITKSPFNASAATWEALHRELCLNQPNCNTEKATNDDGNASNGGHGDDERMQLALQTQSTCEALLRSFAGLFVKDEADEVGSASSSSALSTSTLVTFAEACDSVLDLSLSLFSSIHQHLLLTATTVSGAPSSSQPPHLGNTPRQLSSVTNAEHLLHKRLLSDVLYCVKIVLEAGSNRDRLRTILHTMQHQQHKQQQRLLFGRGGYSDGDDAVVGEEEQPAALLCAAIELLLNTLSLERLCCDGAVAATMAQLSCGAAVNNVDGDDEHRHHEYSSSSSSFTSVLTAVSLLKGDIEYERRRSAAAFTPQAQTLPHQRPNNGRQSSRCRPPIAAINELVRNAIYSVISAMMMGNPSPSTSLPMASTVAALMNNYASCAHAYLATAGNTLLEANAKRESVDKPSRRVTGVDYHCPKASTSGAGGGPTAATTTPQRNTATTSLPQQQQGGASALVNNTVEAVFLAQAPTVVMQAYFDQETDCSLSSHSAEGAVTMAAQHTSAELRCACAILKMIVNTLSVFVTHLLRKQQSSTTAFLVTEDGGEGGVSAAAVAAPMVPCLDTTLKWMNAKQRTMATAASTTLPSQAMGGTPATAAPPTAPPQPDPLGTLTARMASCASVLERLVFIMGMDEEDLNGLDDAAPSSLGGNHGNGKDADGDGTSNISHKSIFGTCSDLLQMFWGDATTPTDNSSSSSSFPSPMRDRPYTDLQQHNLVYTILPAMGATRTIGQRRPSATKSGGDVSSSSGFTHPSGTSLLSAATQLALISTESSTTTAHIRGGADLSDVRARLLSLLRRVVRERVIRGGTVAGLQQHSTAINSAPSSRYVSVNSGTTNESGAASSSSSSLYSHCDVLAVSLMVRVATWLYHCSSDDEKNNDERSSSSSEWFSRHCAPLLVTILQPMVAFISGSGTSSTTDKFFAMPSTTTAAGTTTTPSVAQSGARTNSNTVTTTTTTANTIGRCASAEALRFALTHARREYTFVIQSSLAALTTFIARKESAMTSTVLLLRIYLEVVRELRTEAVKGAPMLDSKVWAQHVLPMMGVVCGMWVEDDTAADNTSSATNDCDYNANVHFSQRQQQQQQQHPLWAQNKDACRRWLRHVVSGGGGENSTSAGAVTTTRRRGGKGVATKSLLATMAAKYLPMVLAPEVALLGPTNATALMRTIAGGGMSIRSNGNAAVSSRSTVFYNKNELLRHGINAAMRPSVGVGTATTNHRGTGLLFSPDRRTQGRPSHLQQGDSDDLQTCSSAMNYEESGGGADVLLSFTMVGVADGRRGLLLTATTVPRSAAVGDGTAHWRTAASPTAATGTTETILLLPSAQQLSISGGSDSSDGSGRRRFPQYSNLSLLSEAYSTNILMSIVREIDEITNEMALLPTTTATSAVLNTPSQSQTPLPPPRLPTDGFHRSPALSPPPPLLPPPPLQHLPAQQDTPTPSNCVTPTRHNKNGIHRSPIPTMMTSSSVSPQPSQHYDHHHQRSPSTASAKEDANMKWLHYDRRLGTAVNRIFSVEEGGLFHRVSSSSNSSSASAAAVGDAMTTIPRNRNNKMTRTALFATIGELMLLAPYRDPALHRVLAEAAEDIADTVMMAAAAQQQQQKKSACAAASSAVVNIVDSDEDDNLTLNHLLLSCGDAASNYEGDSSLPSPECVAVRRDLIIFFTRLLSAIPYLSETARRLMYGSNGSSSSSSSNLANTFANSSAACGMGSPHNPYCYSGGGKGFSVTMLESLVAVAFGERDDEEKQTTQRGEEEEEDVFGGIQHSSQSHSQQQANTLARRGNNNGPPLAVATRSPAPLRPLSFTAGSASQRRGQPTLRRRRGEGGDAADLKRSRSNSPNAKEVGGGAAALPLSPLVFDAATGDFTQTQWGDDADGAEEEERNPQSRNDKRFVTFFSQYDATPRRDRNNDNNNHLAASPSSSSSLLLVAQPIYNDIKTSLRRAVANATRYAHTCIKVAAAADDDDSNADDDDSNGSTEGNTTTTSTVDLDVVLQKVLLDGLLTACRRKTPTTPTTASVGGGGASGVNGDSSSSSSAPPCQQQQDVLALPRAHLYLSFEHAPLLEKLPWEALDVCWGQSISRVPSAEWLREKLLLLAGEGVGQQRTDENKSKKRISDVIDTPPSTASSIIAPLTTGRFQFLLDPEGNLPSTRRRFVDFFTAQRMINHGVVGPLLSAVAVAAAGTNANGHLLGAGSSSFPTAAMTVEAYQRRWLGDIMPRLGGTSKCNDATTSGGGGVGLYTFIGHGHGKAFLPPAKVAEVVGQQQQVLLGPLSPNQQSTTSRIVAPPPQLAAPRAPVMALMGCSSAKLSMPVVTERSLCDDMNRNQDENGSSRTTNAGQGGGGKEDTSVTSVFLPSTAPAGVVMTYLSVGSPSVVGCLWTVSDRQIDKLTMHMLGAVYGIDGGCSSSSSGGRGKGGVGSSFPAALTTATASSPSRGGGGGTFIVPAAPSASASLAGGGGSAVVGGPTALSSASSAHSLSHALAYARRRAKLRYGIGGSTIMYGLPMLTERGAAADAAALMPSEEKDETQQQQQLQPEGGGEKESTASNDAIDDEVLLLGATIKEEEQPTGEEEKASSATIIGDDVSSNQLLLEAIEAGDEEEDVVDASPPSGERRRRTLGPSSSTNASPAATKKENKSNPTALAQPSPSGDDDALPQQQSSSPSPPSTASLLLMGEAAADEEAVGRPTIAFTPLTAHPTTTTAATAQHCHRIPAHTLPIAAGGDTRNAAVGSKRLRECDDDDEDDLLIITSPRQQSRHLPQTEKVAVVEMEEGRRQRVDGGEGSSHNTHHSVSPSSTTMVLGRSAQQHNKGAAPASGKKQRHRKPKKKDESEEDDDDFSLGALLSQQSSAAAAARRGGVAVSPSPPPSNNRYNAQQQQQHAFVMTANSNHNNSQRRRGSVVSSLSPASVMLRTAAASHSGGGVGAMMTPSRGLVFSQHEQQ